MPEKPSLLLKYLDLSERIFPEKDILRSPIKPLTRL